MEKRFSVLDFYKAKETGKKIKMLTAYDYPMAEILDSVGIDAILVGDSLGMVVNGYEDTLRVSVDDIVYHAKAVSRAVRHAMVIGDMPFLSYSTGISDSVRNAGKIVASGGCNAVKVEGGREVSESIKAIISAGIPVMGHLGFTPQSINLFGGHKVQGKTYDKAKKIVEDALLLQEIGVFSVVLECVPFQLAGFLKNKLDIPVIGIGAGAFCDGQVLVTHDILGLFTHDLRHAKKYMNLRKEIENTAREYMKEVDNGVFPQSSNSFSIDPEIMERINSEY